MNQDSVKNGATASAQPRVWLVVGEKRGDNAQIRTLAASLGWSFEEKKIFVKPQWIEGKPRVSPTLRHIDLARSDELRGPWPDLVISAGRRMSSVGLWIKKASGGRTKLVLLGKPRRLIEEVDLAIAACHYVLDDGPNVLRTDFPLVRMDRAVIAKAAAQWRPELEGMSRPLTALFVGGPTGSLRFDLEVVKELFRRTLAGVEDVGGSLFVSTSRRTPPEVVEFLEAAQSDHIRVQAYNAASPGGENPYQAMLELADDFVVTSDSVSMMVEVASLGRPLAIHPLDTLFSPIEKGLAALGIGAQPPPRSHPQPAGGFRARVMNQLGWPIHSRDLSAIPRLLVKMGFARWLGADATPASEWSDDAIGQAADRVRALFPDDVSKSAQIATDSADRAPAGAAPSAVSETLDPREDGTSRQSVPQSS